MTEFAKSRFRGILAAVVACSLYTLAPFAAAEKIYKWVDENGRTHFGDRAPAETTITEEIAVEKSPQTDTSADARNQRTNRLLESFRRDRVEKRAEREAAAAERKERKAKCAVAQDRQRRYADAGSLYRFDDDGERVFLSNENYTAALTRAQAEVDKWCD